MICWIKRSDAILLMGKMKLWSGIKYSVDKRRMILLSKLCSSKKLLVEASVIHVRVTTPSGNFDSSQGALIHRHRTYFEPGVQPAFLLQKMTDDIGKKSGPWKGREPSASCWTLITSNFKALFIRSSNGNPSALQEMICCCHYLSNCQSFWFVSHYDFHLNSKIITPYNI
jgi:hypothetical protein